MDAAEPAGHIIIRQGSSNYHLFQCHSSHDDQLEHCVPFQQRDGKTSRSRRKSAMRPTSRVLGPASKRRKCCSACGCKMSRSRLVWVPQAK
eukprot:3968996-Prymnesium_polylepis.1